MSHQLVIATLGAWALLLVKSALVALVVLGAARLLSRSSAAMRHLVLAAGVGVLVLLPLASALQPTLDLAWLRAPEVAAAERSAPLGREWSGGAPEREPTPAVVDEAGAPPPTRDPPAASLPRDLQPPRLLAALLAAPTLLLGLGLALSLARLRELRREGREVSLPLVDELRRTLGLRGPVTVVESTAVGVPITFGLRHPVVVLPAGAADWAPDALRAALIHELAHVGRRDWVWQLAARLACALYWVNPWVWLLARRLAQEAEQACDDAVLRRQLQAEGYARQLVELARSLRRRRLAPLASVAMARASGLSTRIDALLDGSRDRRPPGRPAISGIAVIALLLTALVAPARLVRAQGPAAEAAGSEGRRATTSELQGRLLYEAVEEGEVETVRQLLAAGFPVNAAVSGDGSPLIAAVRSHDFELLELLVEAGADVDFRVRGDGSPLIVAAARGDLDVVEWLLDRGADPDVAVGGDGSPLIQAAAEGDLRVVRRLLDAGATIDLVVPGDENPLIAAAGAGRLEVVRFLVERDAQVEARVIANRWSGDGRLAGGEVRTPLAMAEKGGHTEVARYLRSVGATRDGDPTLELPYAFAEQPLRSTTRARPEAAEEAWVRLDEGWVVVPRGRIVRFTGAGSLEWPRPGWVRIPAGHAVLLDGSRVANALSVAGEREVTIVDGRGRLQWRVSAAGARDLEGQGTRISDTEPRSARIDSARPVTFYIAMAADGTATYFSPEREHARIGPPLEELSGDEPVEDALVLGFGSDADRDTDSDHDTDTDRETHRDSDD
ncbi:MAG TPA: ankyrin repeat domain-containing protein [Thermoanaerobaculia bacterium]|nr:ankyrin repeat domain-containing protein [Thermoanaerobaculia bacterium]